VRVNEDKQSPFEAKEIAFKCDQCHKMGIAVFPYKPTAVERLRVIKEALDEHRKVCTVQNAEIQREYEIWYPRQGW